MSVCGIPLEVKQCTLLASNPGKLSTVSDIVSVLGNISTARVCTGNPDKKYAVLVETRNGSFRDPSGKFITSCIFALLLHALMEMGTVVLQLWLSVC